jgi:hypothetical protein
MRIARPRRLGVAVVSVGLAGALAGCTTHAPPPISAHDLSKAVDFPEFTVYWSGTEVDGVPVTAADNFGDFNEDGGGFTVYYGDCEGRGTFRTAGCTLPLRITTSLYSPHSDASYGPQHWLHLHGVQAVVYHGGDYIEVYTDHQTIDIAADSPERALDAALALRPLNRTPTDGDPAFPPTSYRVNPTQAELDGNSGATGPTGTTGTTGVTGATTGLAPAAALEPTPNSQS